MVSLDEGVKSAWAQVETQLQRRMDLIPNYVETVKGYAAHEKETFVQVTEARSKVAGAGSIPEKIQANNQLSGNSPRISSPICLTLNARNFLKLPKKPKKRPRLNFKVFVEPCGWDEAALDIDPSLDASYFSLNFRQILSQHFSDSSSKLSFIKRFHE